MPAAAGLGKLTGMADRIDAGPDRSRSVDHEARIRLATIGDALELSRLISPLGYPVGAEAIVRSWRAWEMEGNSALVVEGPGSLLGVVTLHRMTVLHRPKPVGRITSLVVDPGARRRGLGRALTLAAEDAFCRAGCGLVEVTSHMRRTEAHSFYEHLGYERTSFRFAKAVGLADGG